ncbi:tyrosine-type recombinase/integrase [Cytobacillus solani]|uniref:tyrosine-type recombinase/integrase n=1 Tax=Cytobacillus solani TaxID=1637975 RepID=UPI00207A98FA|nr:site-specific integrase [Cytobacillus solani]
MIDAFSFKGYIEARNKAMIAMMADCGLRAMEIGGLLSENVKETTIQVNGKGGKERIVFISPALKRILIKFERLKKQNFINKYTASYYFLTYLGSDLSHNALDDEIKLAGKRTCIEGKRVSPHTFRHFYAVQCLLSGIDLYSLSRLNNRLSELSKLASYYYSAKEVTEFGTSCFNAVKER